MSMDQKQFRMLARALALAAILAYCSVLRWYSFSANGNFAEFLVIGIYVLFGYLPFSLAALWMTRQKASRRQTYHDSIHIFVFSLLNLLFCFAFVAVQFMMIDPYTIFFVDVTAPFVINPAVLTLFMVYYLTFGMIVKRRRRRTGVALS